MDKQSTPCPEPKRRAESGKITAGKPFAQIDSQVMQPLNYAAFNDAYSPDELSFGEDECFVLAEAYVLMEEEYVMWNEDYTWQPNRSIKNEKGLSSDEGELSFSLEESLHYMESFYI